MSIGRVVATLSRHWLLIAALTAVLVGGVAAVTYSTTPSYRASALLQVQPAMGSDGTISLDATLSARERAVTIVSLGNTTQVAELAGRTIGSAPGLESCSFAQSGQSEFLTATCTGTAKSEVAPAANAYAAALRRLLETQRQARIDELAAVYRRQVKTLKEEGVPSANYPAPPDYPSYDELTVVDTAQTPESPFAPRPVRTLTIAFVLGLIVNSGLALLLERVLNRARSPEELRHALGLPVLAAIPQLGRGSVGAAVGDIRVVSVSSSNARAGVGGEA